MLTRASAAQVRFGSVCDPPQVAQGTAGLGGNLRQLMGPNTTSARTARTSSLGRDGSNTGHLHHKTVRR